MNLWYLNSASDSNFMYYEGRGLGDLIPLNPRLPGKRHLVTSPEHNLTMESHVGTLSQILTQPRPNIYPPSTPESHLCSDFTAERGAWFELLCGEIHSVCLLWRQSDTGD